MKLDVGDLYLEKGRYGRFNPVAVIALVVGVAPNLVGFLHATHILARPAQPDIWDKIYPYSWFVGFAVAFLIYLVGMQITKRADQRT